MAYSIPGIETYFLTAALSAVASGAVTPGPATGNATLRFAVAEFRLDPPAATPRGEVTLHVGVTPAPGLVWHEALLAPSRVEIALPDGREIVRIVPTRLPAPRKRQAGTPGPTREFHLPPAEGAAGRREFSLTMKVAADALGGEEVRITLTYGVRAAPSPGADVSSRRAFFETAELTVPVPVSAVSADDLPRGHDGTASMGRLSGDHHTDDRRDVLSPDRQAGTPPPGSPVLGALLFGIAAVLVLVIVAAGFAVRVRARGRRR